MIRDCLSLIYLKNLYWIFFVVILGCGCFRASHSGDVSAHPEHEVEPEKAVHVDTASQGSDETGDAQNLNEKCFQWNRFTVLFFEQSESIPVMNVIEQDREFRNRLLGRVVGGEYQYDIIALGYSTCMDEHEGRASRELALQRAEYLKRVLVDEGVAADRIRVETACNGSTYGSGDMTASELSQSLVAQVLLVGETRRRRGECPPLEYDLYR